jgi:glycosyltransferase involved in cell wall biosynthesis
MALPAMDAWSFGIPTAISNIEPFKEHELLFGIKSAYFDPMDPVNIADVLEQCLRNYDQTKKDAQFSKECLNKITWESVAKKYTSVFNEAINNRF